MNWFRRKPADPPPARPVISNPFAVVPVKAGNVEVRRDSKGMVHLRITMPLAGLRKRVADWLGYDYSRKIELDEHGSLYFSLVDGVNTLKTIVDQMVAKSNRSRKEVEEAVILFTKKLMTMNMICLMVPQDGKKAVGK
jgi:hypothetical protein